MSPTFKWTLFLVIALSWFIVCTAFTDSDPRGQAITKRKKKRKTRNNVTDVMMSLQNSTRNHKTFTKLSNDYDISEKKELSILERFGKPTRSSLRFLHIPKTGSQFAATLVHYCCKDMDTKYIDVMMPFISLTGGPGKYKELCQPCMQQPRSKNGDPWAHTPYDSETFHAPLMTVGLFRNATMRLTSQLTYIRTIGPSLARSFALSKEDAQVLYCLLKADYSTRLKRNLDFMRTHRLRIKPNVEPYAYRPDQFELINYSPKSKHPFLIKAYECVQQQLEQGIPMVEREHINTVTPMMLIDKHFGDNFTGKADFLKCGMRAAVHFPGLQGCQTKMVLGRRCVDPYRVTEQDLAEAKRRLTEEFLFVGVTEEWSLSVRTFHALYGGSMYSDEVAHMRRAKPHTASYEQHLLAVMQAEGVQDPIDAALYRHARQLLAKSVHFIRSASYSTSAASSATDSINSLSSASGASSAGGAGGAGGSKAPLLSQTITDKMLLVAAPHVSDATSTATASSFIRNSSSSSSSGTGNSIRSGRGVGTSHISASASSSTSDSSSNSVTSSIPTSRSSNSGTAVSTTAMDLDSTSADAKADAKVDTTATDGIAVVVDITEKLQSAKKRKRKKKSSWWRS